MRLADRRLKLLLSLAVGLMGLAIGASAASAVILKLPNGQFKSYQPLRGAAKKFDAIFNNLDYNGGAVMPSNINYAVYWKPTSYSPPYPSDYQAGLNQYFTDLAHDSGGNQNVDSVSTQYNDAAGNTAAYKSSFGGR